MQPRTVFSHDILSVEDFDVATRSGNARFIRIRTPDWINVVPLTVDNRVVLVRQFRWGIEQSTLEIPGGMVEPGEDPVEAAVRELREETGYGEGEVVDLGSLHPNPAIQSNRLYMYLVRGLTLQGELRLDDSENIEVETYTIDETRELVARGAISHALAVVTLQRFFALY